MTLPESVHQDLREKYNPDGSTLRRAQLRMLEMLRFLDRVCRENGIRYWIDSGTLLGAVRHGGFIPWDDDSDVCMLREDAEAFKRVMLSGAYGDEFVLQCRETDDGYFGTWYVLRDTRTELVQDSGAHQKRAYRGLQVDIFIYDDRTCQFCVDVTKRVHWHCIQKPLLKIEDREKALKRVRPAAFILFRVLNPLFRSLCPRRKYLAPSFGTWFPWDRIPKELVFPLSSVEFEGCVFPCPGQVDAYLTGLYGDWPSVPSAIQTHDVQIRFL